jgi:hypothetical protein
MGHMSNGNTTPTNNRGDADDANAEYAIALDEREEELDPEAPPVAP